MAQTIFKNDTKDPVDLDQLFDQRMEQVSLSIDRYHEYLVAYTYGLTKQWQDAENIVSELWSYALKHMDVDKIGILPILRRKAYFLFLDHCRRTQHHEVLLEDYDSHPIAAEPDAPVTAAQEREREIQFWSELPGIELSERLKKALWLYHRFGYTYAEISKQMDVPTSTVGDWVKRAEKAIAGYMELRDQRL